MEESKLEAVVNAEASDPPIPEPVPRNSPKPATETDVSGLELLSEQAIEEAKRSQEIDNLTERGTASQPEANGTAIPKETGPKVTRTTPQAEASPLEPETGKRPRTDGTEDGSSPSVKRRARKGGPKRLVPAYKSTFRGNDDAEFSERVEREYIRMRKELIKQYGDSGPGRQKGWRIGTHSHAAIAERLIKEDAAKEEDAPVFGPGVVNVKRASQVGGVPAIKTAMGRSRKSGLYSVPHMRKPLATKPILKDDDPEISDEADDASAEEAFTEEEKPSRGSGSRRGRGRGRGRGRRQSRPAGGRGIRSMAAETLKRVGKGKPQKTAEKGSTRAHGRGLQSDEQPEDKSKDVEPSRIKTQSVAAVAGPPEARPESAAAGNAKILGLGGGLPFKRATQPSGSLQPAALPVARKPLKRSNLHVDDSDLQNHCAIFNSTLYISGIRVSDALLQHRDTYSTQIITVLENVEKLLVKNGSSKENILTSTVVLHNPQEGLAALNEAWKNWIPDPRCFPARTVFGGALIAPNETEAVLVEISVVAAIP